MRRGKRSKVEFISTGDGKRSGVYLPYHLAAASEEDGAFVKVKMTRKAITWVLAAGDLRVVMQEDRRSGEITKIIVKENGDAVMRLKDGLPLQASDVREAFESLDGFDTRPFVELFNEVAQTVIGTSGTEFVRAGDQDDRIKTKGGADFYFAAKGDDKVDLGKGDDTAVYSELNRGIKADLRKGLVNKGGGDKDDLKGVENLVGTEKKDKVRGDGDANRIDGRGGNDAIKGRGGDDSIHGGDGRDRLDGGGGGDNVFGGGGNDGIKGGRGEDGLYGGPGRDRLDGGPGRDFMAGGEDADVFVLDASPSPEGPDQVFDYQAAQGDRLELSGDASDYVVAVAPGSTEIRRDGEVVGVLLDVAAPDVLEDALFT